MVFRFTVVSDEIDEFFREIKIDADATFLDLCQAVLGACGYSDGQMTSFSINDEEGEKKCEITREDVGGSPFDMDVYTMESVSLRSLIDDVPTHLTFIFDTFNNRALDIVLKEMIPGKNLKKAQITRSIGEAPVEIIIDEPKDKGKKKAQPTDDFLGGENFFGSEGFNDDDLSNEGLDINDGPADFDEQSPY